MTTQHTFKLTGMVMSEGFSIGKCLPAIPQTADRVAYFIVEALENSNNSITVCLQEDGTVRVSTRRNPNGYILNKHATINMWTGTLNGHKVHVMLKKITGQLIGWW